jgi:ribosomal protein S16
VPLRTKPIQNRGYGNRGNRDGTIDISIFRAVIKEVRQKRAIAELRIVSTYEPFCQDSTAKNSKIKNPEILAMFRRI